jgi:hypothetical protein
MGTGENGSGSVCMEATPNREGHNKDKIVDRLIQEGGQA